MDNVAQFTDTENGLVFDRATSLLLATETHRGQGREVLERIDLYRADDGTYFEFWRDDPGFPDRTTAVSAESAWLFYDNQIGNLDMEKVADVEFPDYAKADVPTEVWEARMTVWPWVKGLLTNLGYPTDHESLRRAWRALDEVEAEIPTVEKEVSRMTDEELVDADADKVIRYCVSKGKFTEAEAEEEKKEMVKYVLDKIRAEDEAASRAAVAARACTMTL